MHTRYTSLLEQINWLQSRTQLQFCYKFSGCASMADSPTIGDVRALNKLARQLKSQPVKLQFCPLAGPLRILGFLDVPHRNDEDGSSQRGMTVFLTEPREPSSKDGTTYGRLIDFESQKIKKIVLTTSVAALYSFMKCFGSCQFLRELWMDISGEVANFQMRTDAKNLVTTARTIHLPEQKETIHMISMLRKEACSGNIRSLTPCSCGPLDVASDCLRTDARAPPLLGAARESPFKLNMINQKMRKHLVNLDTATTIRRAEFFDTRAGTRVT